MALHPELIDWCCVIHANFGLLSIVPYTHANMIFTSSTPDVVWHFKPGRGKGYQFIKCSFVQKHPKYKGTRNKIL
jgi:hypothetical protein